MSIVDYRRRQMNNALSRIRFDSPYEIAGMLLVLEFLQYDLVSILLGIVQRPEKIKGMRQFMLDYRCQEQVQLVIDTLGRSGPIDKFFSIFTKKNEKDIRTDFVREIISKMNERIEADKAIFEDEIFDENGLEISALSAVLKGNKKEIARHVNLYNIVNKEPIVAFLEENFEDLKRLCNVPGQGYNILEARQQFIDARDQLDSANFYHETHDILSSKFVYDGIIFFISSDFYSGLVATAYGVIAGAVMAFVFSTLSITGATLAIATIVCAAIFLVVIPMLLTSAVKNFVDWVYDTVQAQQEAQLCEKNNKWAAYVGRNNIYHQLEKDQVGQVLEDNDGEREDQALLSSLDNISIE